MGKKTDSLAQSPLLAAVALLDDTANQFAAMIDILEENGNPDPTLVADFECWHAEFRETLDEISKEHE